MRWLTVCLSTASPRTKQLSHTVGFQSFPIFSVSRKNQRKNDRGTVGTLHMLFI